ncbi:hypothetical protein BV20DRAFT_215540 [Pilatotrama ljubarskyi]|nr:hypothetical protein BV20DRAFT_215540 [Pilatotrama ljubarskyi]
MPSALCITRLPASISFKAQQRSHSMLLVIVVRSGCWGSCSTSTGQLRSPPAALVRDCFVKEASYPIFPNRSHPIASPRVKSQPLTSLRRVSSLLNMNMREAVHHAPRDRCLHSSPAHPVFVGVAVPSPLTLETMVCAGTVVAPA